MTELVEKLRRKCETRGLVFSEMDYRDEIEDAISAVNKRRGFTPTTDRPYEEKYSSLIVKMALYSLSKMGAEGETAHSENGIGRSYGNAGDYPDELLNEITPLIKA